jgi:ATP-dependent DNA helicase DinG
MTNDEINEDLFWEDEPPQPPPRLDDDEFFDLDEWDDDEWSDGGVFGDEPIEVPEVTQDFSADGPVARLLGERYRYRDGQVEMARLVRQALNDGRPALLEAGTGCGKSFAYLIPVIASGAPAFISTANKTLQTQLWEKDLPALRQIARRPFNAALLKGRSNYVCRLKLRDAGRQRQLPGLEDDLVKLQARLGAVPTGDVEELRLFGELRDAVTAGEHDCLGRQCSMFHRCFYEKAKLRAEKADVVVINHAVLAYNLRMPFITPRPVVVVDEAHELERYVVNALRLRLEYATVPQLVNDDVVMRHVPDDMRKEAIQINHELFRILSEQPPDGERRWAVRDRLEHGLELAHRLNAIHGELLKAYPPVAGGGEGNEENARHQATVDWAAGLADQVQLLGQQPPEDQVRYCEETWDKAGPDRIVLCQEPIDVAGFLREALFHPVRRVVCTGATLTVEQQFGYFRQQTGVPVDGTIERVIDSPFDYPNQALLYTPGGLEPQYGVGEEDYVLRLGREVWRLLKASRGRAFVLCTSRRRMVQLYELISPHLEYTCYCQGEGLSRGELLELFQNDAGGAVLFATRSFWEGVDIPGEALSLVIIDKLPFAPQRDPVVEYRQQHIRDQGGNPFFEMTLPDAILALKQGVGRLIRNETDRGVVAILDSRVNTRRYGQQVIASLPRARRTRRIADVRAFFAEE